jgi:hypothetical protein
MTFRPGDRVQWGDGKMGTVGSEPRECDPSWGDPFTGVGVEVLPDEATFGTGVILNIATLKRLDGPEVVVMVDLGAEETLEEIVEADPQRGVEPVEHAASRLQKQIMHVVKRAVELEPNFRVHQESRVTVGQATEVLKACGQVPGIGEGVLEQLRDMEVNILVVDPE